MEQGVRESISSAPQLPTASQGADGPADAGGEAVDGQPRDVKPPEVARLPQSEVDESSPAVGTGIAQLRPPTVTDAAPATPPAPLSFFVPTASEVEEWKDMGMSVALAGIWAGVRPLAAKVILDALGLQDTDHMRCLAATDNLDELMGELCDVQVSGKPLTLGDRNKMKNWVSGCRFACGLSPLRSTPVIAPAPVTNIFNQPSSSQAAEAPAPAAKEPVVEIDAVAVQGDKTEVTLISEQEHFDLRLAYRKKGRIRPTP